MERRSGEVWKDRLKSRRQTIRACATAYVAMSKSDRDSIIEAKRIIDGQLALAPSCEELAKQVNISTSKLTKGFSSLFGTSVHAYVIDQRLEKAASLLLESNLNVSQVAMLVDRKSVV